jgi:hypothetical protein
VPVRSLLRWLPLLPLLPACGGEVKEEQPNTNPPPAVGTPNDKPPEPLPAPPVRPPQINGATFTPAKPTAHDEIKVKVDAIDPDSNYVELSYLWLINGRQNPALRRDTVKAGELRKGDELSVEVTARDQEGNESKYTSPAITVVNAPPVFSSDPRLLTKLDGYKVEARDPDKELLTYSVSGGPEGLAIDAGSGTLKYKGTTSEKGGHYSIVVKVDDGDGGTAEWRLEVDISPGSDAVKAAKEAEKAGKAKAAEPAPRF